MIRNQNMLKSLTTDKRWSNNVFISGGNPHLTSPRFVRLCYAQWLFLLYDVSEPIQDLRLGFSIATLQAYWVQPWEGVLEISPSLQSVPNCLIAIFELPPHEETLNSTENQKPFFF